MATATAKGLAGWIGREVSARFEGLTIRGTILDARRVFARTDVLFRPAAEAGTGEQWIAADRLAGAFNLTTGEPVGGGK